MSKPPEHRLAVITEFESCLSADQIADCKVMVAGFEEEAKFSLTRFTGSLDRIDVGDFLIVKGGPSISIAQGDLIFETVEVADNDLMWRVVQRRDDDPDHEAFDCCLQQLLLLTRCRANSRITNLSDPVYRYMKTCNVVLRYQPSPNEDILDLLYTPNHTMRLSETRCREVQDHYKICARKVELTPEQKDAIDCYANQRESIILIQGRPHTGLDWVIAAMVYEFIPSENGAQLLVCTSTEAASRLMYFLNVVYHRDHVLCRHFDSSSITAVPHGLNFDALHSFEDIVRWILDKRKLALEEENLAVQFLDALYFLQKGTDFDKHRRFLIGSLPAIYDLMLRWRPPSIIVATIDEILEHRLMEGGCEWMKTASSVVIVDAATVLEDTFLCLRHAFNSATFALISDSPDIKFPTSIVHLAKKGGVHTNVIKKSLFGDLERTTFHNVDKTITVDRIRSALVAGCLSLKTIKENDHDDVVAIYFFPSTARALDDILCDMQISAKMVCVESAWKYQEGTAFVFPEPVDESMGTIESVLESTENAVRAVSVAHKTFVFGDLTRLGHYKPWKTILDRCGGKLNLQGIPKTDDETWFDVLFPKIENCFMAF